MNVKNSSTQPVSWGLLVLTAFLLVFTLSACQSRSTPPGADIAGGKVEETIYTYLYWEEGLAIMIWHDLEAVSSNASSSTTDPVYRADGSAQSRDGRRFQWAVESEDGITGRFWIDGQSYDLSQGTLFIVSTHTGETRVRQLRRSLAGVRPDNDSCTAFAMGDPDITRFMQEVRDAR